MKEITKSLTSIVFSVLVMMMFTIGLAAQPAYAAKCTVRDENGKLKEVETSFNFNCDPASNSKVSDLLILAINTLSALVGVAIVVGIVLAGIKYSSAQGDAARVKEAKDMIVNAVIALFLFIFLFAAANFLVPGGLFT